MMKFSYEIRQIFRPDGRTIWRIIEIFHLSNGGKYEEGIAAFDTEQDAEKYLAARKKR